MEDATIDELKKNLSLGEILQLKEKVPKKVYQNFLVKSYIPKSKTKIQTEKQEKKPTIETEEDREFRQIFGCKRNKNAKNLIKLPDLNDIKIIDKNLQEEEEIDEKERPIEKSTKTKPSQLRMIFKPKQEKKIERRDPRFDNNSGYFNPTRFDKSYGFLKDLRENDKKLLKKKFNQLKDEDKKKEVGKAIQMIENQQKSEAERKRKAEMKEKLINEKRDKIFKKKSNIKESNDLKTQKKVFVNKSEIKKKELVEKFKELKNKKQLNKYLEKKRKKNTSKERKLVFTERE